MKIFLLISILIIVGSCGLDRQKFEKEGYQVFEKYSIAIKAPCQFQVDNTIAIDSSLGVYVLMVCPQIFKDSTRTSFDLQKLLESGNSVYHLRILQKKTSQQSEFLLDQQKKIVEHFNASQVEEIEVDAKRTLIYDIEDNKVTEAYVPDESFIYYIAVSGDSSRRNRLSEILRTVKFGQFN